MNCIGCYLNHLTHHIYIYKYVASSIELLSSTPTTAIHVVQHQPIKRQQLTTSSSSNANFCYNLPTKGMVPTTTRSQSHFFLSLYACAGEEQSSSSRLHRCSPLQPPARATPQPLHTAAIVGAFKSRRLLASGSAIDACHSKQSSHIAGLISTC